MRFRRQSQRAGENSHQVQAAGNAIVHHHHGISEERVRAIMRENAEHVKADFVAEAYELIDERIAALDDRLVPELDSRGQLDSFTDPAFLRSYRKAQNGAAASERAADYEMLTALLAKRTEAPLDRARTSTIEHAIEIIDQIDDNSLRALTVLYTAAGLFPQTGDVLAGISALDGFFGRIIDGPLPEGAGWADHLEVLNLVRMNALMRFDPFIEHFASMVPGWVAPGLEIAASPEFVGGGGQFDSMPWGTAVVDHELKPGYKRISAMHTDGFRSDLRALGIDQQAVEHVVARAEEVFGLGRIDNDARRELGGRMRSTTHLGAVISWWAQVPVHVQFTSVGRVVADANVYRLDGGQQLPTRHLEGEI